MRTIKILILFTFIACIYSCSKDNQTASADQIDNELEIEKRQSVITDWLAPSCLNITIFIDNTTCGPNWAGSLEPAMNAYNAVEGLAIHMEQVFQEPADIVIRCVDFADENNYGRGEWPIVDYLIGGTIFLNTDFETSCSDPCFFQGALMHEMAHNIGFGHGDHQDTDGAVGPWIFNSDSGTFTQANLGVTKTFVNISGTPQFDGDALSVFNVHECDDQICTFTENDIKALRAIYALDEACDCPEALADPCDCPSAVSNICDCPEAVLDPCDCPDLFADDIEYVCYCVCYQLSPIEESKDFELGYVEFSRTEVDCNQAATISCTENNNSISYCEIERECREKEIVIVEEEEKCYCLCTINSSIGLEEPLTWEFEIDCDKPEECNGGNADASCIIIRK